MADKPTFDTVTAYINRLPNTDAFSKLTEDDKQKQLFGAIEQLKGRFKPGTDPVLNDRVIALQILSNMATDADGFKQLRQQGIQSYSVKDSSVTFADGQSEYDAEIWDILHALNPSNRKRARLGRLV